MKINVKCSTWREECVCRAYFFLADKIIVLKSRIAEVHNMTSSPGHLVCKSTRRGSFLIQSFKKKKLSHNMDHGYVYFRCWFNVCK